MTHVADLTNEVVLKIARLANLVLSSKAIEKFRTQLTQTIHYVENLDELDTSSIPPTSHSTQSTNVYFEDGTENTRKLTAQEATSNATRVKNGMCIVPRIMG